ncbi:unnamed protein product [Ilex paraguariensis]|uniref:Uncharacterized protein n=1 Tax=Ilex paraguariensis TaxID=185542 RepID=A0ABC8T3S7_9AQUA
MSYTTPIDDYCDAWQADYTIIPNTQPNTSRKQFYTKVQVEFTYPVLAHEEDEEYEEDSLLLNNGVEGINHVMEFWIPENELVSNSSQSTISSMLSQVGVPLERQPFMIHRISDCAQKMASAVHNLGRKVLPMMVDISVVVDNGQYEEDDAEIRVLRQSMEGVE